MEIRNVVEDVGFLVDIKTGQGDLSILGELETSKQLIFVPHLWGSTSQNVQRPYCLMMMMVIMRKAEEPPTQLYALHCGHLGFKMTNLYMLIYMKLGQILLAYSNQHTF